MLRRLALALYLRAEPGRVSALAEFHPEFGTDVLASAMLVFENGTSTFTCSTLTPGYQRVLIMGTHGWIEIEIPFNAPPDKPCRLLHNHDGETREVLTEAADQYALQGDLFSEAVLLDAPVPTPIEDAVSNMNVIEAIFHSAKSGRWVEI